MQTSGRILPHKRQPKTGLTLLAGCCALAVLLTSPAYAAPVDAELRARLRDAIADTSSFEDKFTASVWLTDMALRLQQRVPDSEERVRILRHVHEEARRANLHPETGTGSDRRGKRF